MSLSKTSFVYLPPSFAFVDRRGDTCVIYKTRRSFYRISPRLYTLLANPSIILSAFPNISPGFGRVGSLPRTIRKQSRSALDICRSIFRGEKKTEKEFRQGGDPSGRPSVWLPSSIYLNYTGRPRTFLFWIRGHTVHKTRTRGSGYLQRTTRIVSLI